MGKYCNGKMKKITSGVILLLAILVGVGSSCKGKKGYSITSSKETIDVDTSYIDTGSFSYGDLSWNDIMKMDSIEKKQFYHSLTNSLPDLWKTRDVDRVSYAVEDTIPSLPIEKLIHLYYRQRVNGYSVKVDFDRDLEQMRGQEGYSVYMGHAILSFSKPGHSFNIYCDNFSDEQLKVWDMTNTDYYKKDKKSIDLSQVNAGETVKLDYIRPKNGEYFSHRSPFYFKDMDYDGEDELVVNNLSMGSRGYNTYDVFKVLHVEKPLRLQGLPFTDGSYKITNYNVEYEPKTQCILDKRYDGFDAYGYFRYKSVPSNEKNGLKRGFVLVDAEDMGFYHPTNRKASDSVNLIQPYKRYERINGKLELVERGVYESGNYGWNNNEVVLEKIEGEK